MARWLLLRFINARGEGSMPSTSISSTRPSAATGEGMALFQAAGMGTNHRDPTRKGRKPYGPEGVVIGKDAILTASRKN